MSIYSAMITLFLILDPFGNIPFFASVLKDLEPRKRLAAIVREMVIALAVLIVFLFFGKYILKGLDISDPALTITGGIILFIIAIKMIFPEEFHDVNKKAAPTKDPLIVPLAVPSVAGPTTISMLILFSNQYPQKIFSWLIALLTAWSLTLVILVSSNIVIRILGKAVIDGIAKLMGIILTTMAVQMFITGVKAYFF